MEMGNGSSCSSCSGSSISRSGNYLSNDIYNGSERCSHCDMQLSNTYYVASGYSAFCDERCYRNYLITQNKKTTENEKLAVQEANKLLRERNEIQIIVDSMSSLVDKLLKKNKELEEEIRIRNEGIDKFTLMDFE